MSLIDNLSYTVIGAGINVHKELGCGFLEKVYQEALAVELSDKGIRFEREVLLPIDYRGRRLQCEYKCDFIVEGELIVELKALSRLVSENEAQLINYLNASKLPAGLLLNFGSTRMEIKRFFNTQGKRSIVPFGPGDDGNLQNKN